jgi:hypothetical protein
MSQDRDINSIHEKPSEECPHVIKDIFEQMYFALLDYYFEKGNFLAMLTKWEEILGLSTPGEKEKEADVQEPASSYEEMPGIAFP